MYFTREGAKLKLAILCLKISETKWWQFAKRKMLYNEAVEFAKKNEIEFPGN